MLEQAGVGGYMYKDALFQDVHLTSVPRNLDEALEYFRWVAETFDTNVKHIAYRAPDETEYKILPYVYDYSADEEDFIKSWEEEYGVTAQSQVN